MCGRFTLRTPASVLVSTFQLVTEPLWQPRYNIAPTQSVPVLRWDEGAGGRVLTPLYWGLIPSWAKDPSIGNRMINARGESIAEKPSFRSAFKRRRCIVVADGYYEWKKTGSKKQPYLIHLPDEQPFAMAGLWETWTRPASGDDEKTAIESCTVITTTSNEKTRDIHDRMPVILHQQDWSSWLDPHNNDTEHLKQLLLPFDSDLTDMYPVSTHVNSPRNEDPSCTQPM